MEDIVFFKQRPDAANYLAQYHQGLITETEVYFEEGLVYTFAQPLTERQHRFLHAVAHGPTNTEDMEKAIRMIRGGYKNGDWINVGSLFFGFWFNETTAEVLKEPPQKE